MKLPGSVDQVWGKDYKFCPECGSDSAIRYLSEAVRRQVCDVNNGGCGFIRWNSPIPVVAGLVPFPAEYIGKGDGFDLEGANLELERFVDPVRTGVLLVRRAVEPFVGSWVLPGGHIEPGETPSSSCIRELFEETGVIGHFETSLNPCCPLPGKLNQVAMHMMVRPSGGTIKAGDDVSDARIFGINDIPEIPFTSHTKTLADYFDGLCGIIKGVRHY
ncbi:hypothetical protein COU74_04425 [Candidatus Peregrinibacteria bacterium CG10_big_fil_rev_8_21_14_0_10_36_19]|nr:MAG: hypothetical protein COU74_04425 [Candidatus Peregrinibacteria bacterium CG10_big_fil_rev_8_21_14_0_10_36_19]